MRVGSAVTRSVEAGILMLRRDRRRLTGTVRRRDRRRLTGTVRPPAPPRAQRLRVALRPRWILAGLVLFILGNVLFVEAYTNARFTPDALHGGSSDGSVPEAVRDGGPIIDTTGAQPRSYRLPARTIVLTFDDGPDPRWTPEVLRVLRTHGVPATFFLVGSQVARHPGLTRRLAREGHEIGAHTFSHPRLTEMPAWRRDLENSQTQMAIAYAANVKTSLLRLPYSSFADALDAPSWSLVQNAGNLGYITVLNDTDSRDWARPGTDQIIRGATPPGDRGAIILMHDAGGDRSQTVAALDRFIPAMKQRGYRFTTISDVLSRQLDAAQPVVTNRPAPDADRWRGRALVWAVGVADGLMNVLWAVLIVVGVLTLTRTLLLFLFAVRHARRRRATIWSWGTPVTAPVSVIVPAYNESQTIGPAVRSLASSAHPRVEVVVVDDASTDGTGDIVKALGLPNVRLVRVPCGGKATALNTGVALARHDLVVMVDADTVVEPESIHRLVQPFADPRSVRWPATSRSATVGASSPDGSTSSTSSASASTAACTTRFGCMPDDPRCPRRVPSPGGPGLRRAQPRNPRRGHGSHDGHPPGRLAGGLRGDGPRVHRGAGHHVGSCGSSATGGATARCRRCGGTAARSSNTGRPAGSAAAACRFIALFSVVLPLLAPVLDILAIYGMFFLDRWETLVGWFAVLVVQVVTAILAFRLDKEPLRPLWALPFQQFVYRQMMYLVLVHSAVTALTGGRLRWQKLRRSGEVVAGVGP